MSDLRAAYESEGVVVVRGAFTTWVDGLLPRALELVDAAQREERETGERPGLKCLWQTEPVFRDFAFHSPAAALAAAMTGSRQVRLALDQIWAKAPRSRHITRWHFDRPAWPVTGMMLPSIWAPLTPVTPENSLVFAAGSHLVRRDPQDREFTNYGVQRTDPAVRFLTFDMQAGDALVFHPLSYHWCGGNTDKGWRIALTTRWLGDDIRYDPTRDYLDEGLTFEGCVPGESLSGPEFPIVNFEKPWKCLDEQN